MFVEHSLVFAILKPLPVFFSEASNKPLPFYTKVSVKTTRFLEFRCTSLLLQRKPVDGNYQHIFNEFKQKCPLYELMKLRLPLRML